MARRILGNVPRPRSLNRPSSPTTPCILGIEVLGIEVILHPKKQMDLRHLDEQRCVTSFLSTRCSNSVAKRSRFCYPLSSVATTHRTCVLLPTRRSSLHAWSVSTAVLGSFQPLAALYIYVMCSNSCDRQTKELSAAVSTHHQGASLCQSTWFQLRSRVSSSLNRR
jgi:hypothetical protein